MSAVEPASDTPSRARSPIGVATTQPSLEDRPLLDTDQAAGVAALFKVLASDTRLRLLHALHRSGEVRITDLAEVLGTSQQAISNQVQRLLDRKILAARRDGTSVYYRIADPCIPALLQSGICALEDPTCERPA